MASRSEDSFILLGGHNRTSESGRSAKLDSSGAVRAAPDSPKVPITALTSEALSALQHKAPSTGGTDDNVDWVNDHHSIATSAIHRTIEDAGESANALDGSAAIAAADRGPSEAELHHWDRQAANGNITMCACKFPVHVNIMVYGESGLGKTDMPGWGDSINLVDSLKTVVEFMLHQRQMDYVSNRAGQTDYDPLPGAKMTRGITVCLYFLPPHSVKTIDWVMMAAISKLVAVVPVIAKADTFTPQELEEFRREILQVINHSQTNATTGGQTGPDPPGAAASSPAGPDHPHVRLARDLCLQTYQFRKSDLDQVGASGDQGPPFAIVSSEGMLTTEQAQQFGGEPGDPCRAYSWGAVFPFDRRHSSLIVLKQLLCGHRNAAIHDLLRDSWTRACTFAKQFEQQLATKGVNCMYGSLAAAAAVVDAGLLQPLVDEVCSSSCVSGSELQDRLRAEEHKAAIEGLKVARAEKDRLTAELQQLTRDKDELTAKREILLEQGNSKIREETPLEGAAKDWVALAEGEDLVERLLQLAKAPTYANDDFEVKYRKLQRCFKRDLPTLQHKLEFVRGSAGSTKVVFKQD